MQAKEEISVEFTLPSDAKPDDILVQRWFKKIMFVSIGLALVLVATYLF
jgi:hypothetical protein